MVPSFRLGGAIGGVLVLALATTALLAPARAGEPLLDAALGQLVGAPSAHPRDAAETARALRAARVPAAVDFPWAAVDARTAAWRLSVAPDAVALAYIFAVFPERGGFGASRGHAPAAVDTAEVLLAAADGDVAAVPLEVAAAVAALTRHQRPDGGFAANGADSDLPTTCLGVRALAAWTPLVPNPAALRGAVAWLEAADASANPALYGALRADALAAAGALTGADVAALRALGPGGVWYDRQGTAAAARALVSAAPNLNFAEASLSSTDVAAGEPVDLNMTLRNTGLTAAPATTVEVRFGAAGEARTLQVPALAPGDDAPLTTRFDTAGAATGLTVAATVDPDDRLWEADEDDNTRTLRLRVRPPNPVDLELRPDLLAVAPPDLRAQQAFDVRATVLNRGDLAAPATHLALYLGVPEAGGRLLADVAVPAIDARAQTTVVVPLAGLPTQATRLVGWVDPEQRLNELHRDNDRAVRSLRVAGDVDLAMLDGATVVEPAAVVNVGTPVTVRGRVQNHGAAPSPATRIGLEEAGGARLDAAPVPVLQPGQVMEVALHFIPDTVGNVALLLVADADDLIVEADEIDNLSAVVVDVQSHDLQLPAGDPAEVYGNVRDTERFGVDGYVTNTANTIEPAVWSEIRLDAPNGQLMAEGPCGAFPAAPYGGKSTKYCALTASAGGAPPGDHSVYFCVDTRNALVERDETNNCTYVHRHFSAGRDTGITLSVDPPTPDPGTWATLTWRLTTQPFPPPDNSIVRVRADGASAIATWGAIPSQGTQRWQAPQTRRVVHFEATADAGALDKDQNPADNRVALEVAVGGPPRVVGVLATGPGGAGLGVSGRAGRLKVAVDAPTDVVYGGVSYPATPDQPASIPYTPPNAGEVRVSVATRERPVAVAWPLEIRRPGVPTGLALAPAPEGALATWDAAPGATGYLLLRDGVPVGKPTRELAFSAAPPADLSAEGRVDLTLPRYDWVGAVAFDAFDARARTMTQLRLLALDETGTWREVHSETAYGGAAVGVRPVRPFRAKHLRLESAQAVRLVTPRLWGYPPIAGTTFLDDRIGAAPATYRVTSLDTDLPDEGGAPVQIDVPLEGPAADPVVSQGEVRLTLDAPPGDRRAGYLVEIDGQPLPDIDVPASLVPLGFTPPTLPLQFPLSWNVPAGVGIEARFAALFDPLRPISAVPFADAASGWQATDAGGQPFATGMQSRLELFRPARDTDGDFTLTPTFRGPPIIDPASRTLAFTVPQGHHALAIYPYDHAGQRGVPTLLDVATGAPRGLGNVTARLDANGAVVLGWVAPPEVNLVGWDTAWGQSGTAPAAAGSVTVFPGMNNWNGRISGLVTFHLTPLDVARNPGPPTNVSIQLGPNPLPMPTRLIATVSGFQVTLNWQPPAGGAAGYNIFEDGAFKNNLNGLTRIYLEPVPGPHTFGVASTDATGASGPPALVDVNIADDGPPGPAVFADPPFTLSDTTGFGINTVSPVAEDLQRLDMFVNSQDISGANPHVHFEPGVTRFRVQIRARDFGGNTSAWNEQTYIPPASFPADGFGVSALRADGTVAITAPANAQLGHFVYRDGARLCRWDLNFAPFFTFSSGRPAVWGGPIGLDVDDVANSWRADVNDPAPILTLNANGFVGVPLDRLRVAFTADRAPPSAFHVEVQPVGLPWHEVARVRNNVDRVRILDLPDTPRTGYELLRFVVDEHPAGQAVEIVGFQSLQCAPPATDTPPAGHHTYTARVWGPDYSPGPMSDPIVLNVPFIDLALDPGSLRLSDDEFTPGDSVAVVVPVRNPSGLDAPAVTVSLSVAALDCAVGAHEIARTVIAVPAGSAGAAVLPYLVQDTSVVLCARVDPDGVIPEQFENNNTASRALAPDRAYRTEVWANGNLVVFACDAAVAYTVRPADGGAPRSGRLQPGTAARMALSGSASVSADAPVTVMVGSTVDATSTVVRDCNGDVRWTNAVADVPQNFFIDPLVVNRSPGTVVYAPNADAHVQASEPFRWVNGVSVPSGAALFDGVVPAGQLGWFNPHGRLNGRGAHSLRLESDVPVIAWSYADLGFAFVGADGRMTGTELHGFSAISSGQFQTGGERDSEEIVIVSYADNNRVELVRDDTGAVLDTFLLPADGIASHLIHLADNPGFMPLSVHATGTTAALNMSLAGSPAYGYAHALYIPGRSGLVFDREFIVPLTRNGRSADYAAVTALYDGTTVSVTAPDTGVLVLRRLLARGQAIDLLSEAVATDDPRRRRLVVESDRPVSVFSGTGLAAAEMVPMLSAPENRPDLTVADLFTTPETPLPGDILQAHGELRNIGVQRARNVRVRVFDGDPAEGRILYEGGADRIDAGQPVPVDFALGVGEGQRVLTWVVDPDDTVVEDREDNNVGRYVIANPPDLLPLPPTGDLTAGEASTLSLVLRNDGGQSVAGARLRVFADETLLGETTADAAGASDTPVEFPWRPSVAGPVTITVEAIAPDGVTEARVDNNRANAVLDVAPAPRDVLGDWTVTPPRPGPCDEVSLSVVLNEPLAVAIEAWIDGARVAAGLTDDAGVGRLTWIGDKALGHHAVRLVVDAADAIAESDEGNNISDLDVEVVPYAIALDVVGPADPVDPGAAVALTVTPSAALPEGATLTAEGFAPALAAGDAPVVLHGLAPEDAGPVTVRVKAHAGPAVVATGLGRLTVVPAQPGLELHLWPVVAGPGEPVTLQTTVRGLGTVRFVVDGVELTRLDTPTARSVLRALSLDDRPGAHAVTAELLGPGDAVLGSDVGDFSRVAGAPLAHVDVHLDDQVAPEGTALTVPVTLTNSDPALPVALTDVVLAVTDDPPTHVIVEAPLGEARVVGAVPEVAEIPLALPWTPGHWRLIARAEVAGGLAGVGTAGLELLATDATPPPDAARPVDAAPPPADAGSVPPIDAAPPPPPDAAPPPPPPPPPVPDAGGDPRLDAAPVAPDAGGDPRGDGAPPPPPVDARPVSSPDGALPDGAWAADGVTPPTPDARPAPDDGPAPPTPDARPPAPTPDAKAPAPTPDARADGLVGEAGPEDTVDGTANATGGRRASSCDCRVSDTRGATSWAALGALAVVGAVIRRRRMPRR